MNNYDIVFESKRIRYVKLTKNLIYDYLNMVNDKSVSENISHNPKKITYEEELAWIDKKLKDNSIIFSMIEKETNEYIGNLEIMKIVNNIGELGIAITPKMQNKHYGTESIKAIIDYALIELKLSGIDLNVYKTNTRAICCYEKVGFKKIGTGKTKEDIHMIYGDFL